MENNEVIQLVKKFDNYVHFSLNRKDESDARAPQQENKVQSYLNEMEKRLKLRPRSHEQKFQKLLKPMKDLKSFVSVKEFMECLGTVAVGKIADRSVEKGEKTLKLQYENLRGGYYLQKIEEHLKSKKFKRSTRNSPYFVTEPENHALETSEYRTWVENTLNKISLKNDYFFKKPEAKAKGSRAELEQSVSCAAEKDCLIQEHQKEYADQYKVVPHIRELCNQQYESFTKISTLLTGRLRKILKNNCAVSRNSAVNIKTRPQPDPYDKIERPLKKSHRTFKENKENTTRRVMKKRVQTAGVQRREQCQLWRESVNNKLKHIISQSSSESYPFTQQ